MCDKSGVKTSSSSFYTYPFLQLGHYKQFWFFPSRLFNQPQKLVIFHTYAFQNFRQTPDFVLTLHTLLFHPFISIIPLSLNNKAIQKVSKQVNLINLNFQGMQCWTDIISMQYTLKRSQFSLYIIHLYVIILSVELFNTIQFSVVLVMTKHTYLLTELEYKSYCHAQLRGLNVVKIG